MKRGGKKLAIIYNNNASMYGIICDTEHDNINLCAILAVHVVDCRAM